MLGDLAFPAKIGKASKYHFPVKALEGRPFIMVGLGRWGSANPGLGVPVTYADICHSHALVEIAVAQGGRWLFCRGRQLLCQDPHCSDPS